jgi:phage tail sheath protein FI
MTTYKTPGVYVKEEATLPPSVAEVSTAVPAFIGYTAIGPTADANGKVIPVVRRIDTLLDFENLFGSAKPSAFAVGTSDNSVVSVSRTAPAFDFLLYYNLALYFQNGGGTCYIVSIGDYRATPSAAHFLAGLAALEREDEPTLVLLTDAVNLSSDDYATVCVQALAQCAKLGDRFAILDVASAGVDDFRNKIIGNNLMYGAAYYPFVQTTLTWSYGEDQVTLSPVTASQKKVLGDRGVVVNYVGASGDTPKVKVVIGSDPVSFAITAAKVLTINSVAGKTGADIAAAWAAWRADSSNNTMGFDIVKNGDGGGPVDALNQTALDSQPASFTLASIRSSNTALYNAVKSSLATQRITLPPAAAMAGVYASVDRERGVWKAPANVSLSSVIGPTVKISAADQENLNIDSNAGKSINAIRAFSGKGTLVWGARTLAGNDNEWRYISVRRLFNMIEESTRNATSFAVFEPNDSGTWLKVKAMIESYLYGVWQQGALAGASPDDAYFVEVGLGKTMNSQDVLEGRMIVKIGIAAVRPAEFIVLTFTHKLQQA